MVRRERRKLHGIGKAGLILVGISSVGSILYSGTDIGRGAVYFAGAALCVGVALLAVDEMQFRRSRRKSTQPMQ